MYLCNARVLPEERKDHKLAAEEQTRSVDAGDADLPPLTILKTLSCALDGTINDFNGKIVGEVYEGDKAEFCSKMCFCDGNGNVMDYKNKPVGKCRTLAAEGLKTMKAAEYEEKTEHTWATGESPFAKLAGIKSGQVRRLHQR